MTNLTDNKIRSLIIEYQSGFSITNMGKKYNIEPEKVKELLTKNNIPIRNPKNSCRTIISTIKNKNENLIIIDYINNKMTLASIGRKYNLLHGIIKRMLLKKDIKIRNPRESFGKINYEQMDEMAKLYNEGYSSWEIASKFNVLNVCVLKILRKKGVKMRSRSKAARIYELDENYFEIIDTPEKAYFLGFIYAEGHSEKNGRNSLMIGLQYKDKYILEFFKNDLRSNRPLEFRKRKLSHHDDVSVLRVSSLKMVNDLVKLGIPMGNKSYILTLPKFLNNDLMKYFLIAEFDGDGCIYTNNKYCRIYFSGATELMRDIHTYLDNKFNMKSSFLNKKGKAPLTIIMNSEYSLKVLNWFYENPPKLFLKRKYEKYIDYVNKIKTLKFRNPNMAIEINKSLQIIENNKNKITS